MDRVLCCVQCGGKIQKATLTKELGKQVANGQMEMVKAMA